VAGLDLLLAHAGGDGLRLLDSLLRAIVNLFKSMFVFSISLILENAPSALCGMIKVRTKRNLRSIPEQMARRMDRGVTGWRGFVVSLVHPIDPRCYIGNMIGHLLPSFHAESFAFLFAEGLVVVLVLGAFARHFSPNIDHQDFQPAGRSHR
jgi:hypothetical protein